MATTHPLQRREEEALTCPVDDDLFEAIRADDSEIVERLLSKGANANQLRGGMSGLHLCSTVGAINCAKAYLHHGANVNEKDYESGWTPLHRAFYAGRIEISFLLLKAGALLEPDSDPSASPTSSSTSTSTYPSTSTSTSTSVIDNEGLSPVDLLSEMLSHSLAACAKAPQRSSIMCFGKADFPLGMIVFYYIYDIGHTITYILIHIY
jgi:ankyrin repeat protein